MTTCPLTEEEWLKTEKNFKCSSGIYHCLRTRENFLIEVCAPRNTMIQRGGCPYWNIYGNVDQEDCSIYPGCPDEPFLSNAVYKYPFCYQQWSTSIPTSTSKSTQNTTLEANSTLMSTKMEYISTTSFPESSSNGDLLPMVSSAVNVIPYLMMVLSCFVVVGLVLAMVVFHLRSKPRQNGRDVETQQQSIPLVEHNDTEQQPVSGKDNEEPTSEEPTSATPLLPGNTGEFTEGNTEEFAEVVEVDEETNFVKHNAYVKGTKLLKSNHALMIIGYPGSGKSFTGRQIVRHFEKKGWKSSSFDTLENSTVDMTTGRQVVFIDNCFGKRDLKPSVHVVHQMKEKLTPILNDGFKKSDGLKCILSMEKRAYETYKELLKDIHTLNHSVIIDMDSDESYTHSQKERVMEIILGNTEQQSKQRIKKCLEENSEARLIGYPLKVWFLKHIPDLEVKSNDWIRALRKIFDDMRISQEDIEKQKNFAALMYVMLKGQFSAEDEFDEQCMEQLHSPPLHKEDLLGLLSPLKGYIKIRDENTCVFAHEILYVAAFIEFHKNDAHTFFQYCNMKAILEIVKLSCDDTVGNPLVINLERDHYHFLVDRIIEGGYQEKFFGRQLGEAATFGLVLNRKQGIKETEKKLKAAKENNAENRVTELEKELKAQNDEYDELLHEITKTAESVSN